MGPKGWGGGQSKYISAENIFDVLPYPGNKAVTEVLRHDLVALQLLKKPLILNQAPTFTKLL